MNKEQMWLGTFCDVSEFGTDKFPLTTETIKCNAAATYRCYSERGNYTDESLLEGVQYLMSVTKITTTTDTAVAANAMTAHF